MNPSLSATAFLSNNHQRLAAEVVSFTVNSDNGDIECDAKSIAMEAYNKQTYIIIGNVQNR